MAKTFSFPLYVAETTDGERIAGPSFDCLRMNLAAQMFERFEHRETRTVWIGTLSPEEARVFSIEE